LPVAGLLKPPQVGGSGKKMGYLKSF